MSFPHYRKWQAGLHDAASTIHARAKRSARIAHGERAVRGPDLAIREMYQNALDACRYRQARLLFLERRGKQSRWIGKITFQQGEDRGRPYIECSDNGIGMGLYEIDSCFSRAGKRFADLPEFIEEQELWLQCSPKIRMTPNSQFGIGVLSYFMIADEIELTTCRLDLEGHPGKELSVKIPGGGTLFRVQPTARTVDAGTSVRLYLREDWKNSCCDILEKLLIIAEFETEAKDQNRRIVWQPGRPLGENQYLQTDCADFWWAKSVDGGQVLADGIQTHLQYSNKLGERDQPFGALVNLRSDRRPKLTVDRKKILEFDEEWVLEMYSLQARHLLNAPWLRFTWLWRLPESILAAIKTQLLEADLLLPIGYAEDVPKSYALYGDDERIQRWAGVSELRELGFPLRVVEIKHRDRDIVDCLTEALSQVGSSNKLNILNRLCSTFIDVHSPFDVHSPLDMHSDQREMWYQKRLEDILTKQELLHDDLFRRAALYVQLGFPRQSG